MKVPVECPHGCGFTLEMDFNKDHQHIQCHECLCEFCAVCIGRFTLKESEEQFGFPVEHLERMSKAHLN